MPENNDIAKNNALHEDSWRVFRIVSEFVDGFETMTDIGPSVSIFGSARFVPGSHYYKLAEEVAKKIVDKGFAVITGGGPGVMEAANKGAQEVKGLSCGLGIDVPHELGSNKFIDHKYNLSFRYFFVRKVMLIKYSQAFIIFPGGYGTLDEAFEAATLIQTGKVFNFPLIFVGVDYWQPLFDFLKNRLLAEQAISEGDLKRLILTDSVEDILKQLECCTSSVVEPTPDRPVPRRLWQLMT